MKEYSKRLRISILAVGLLILATAVMSANAGEDGVLWPDGMPLPPYIPLQDYWDSGDQSITAGTTKTFLHNLGGNPGLYMVYVYGKGNDGYHQANYGTNPVYIFPHGYGWIGLEWEKLTSTAITVHRGNLDNDSGVASNIQWDKVRIIILKPGWPAQRGIPYVDHYVEFTSISPGQEKTLDHNLGGDPGQYLVYVYGYNSEGYHHANYGTTPTRILPSENWVGLEWKNLTSSSITLSRADDDGSVSPKKQWNNVKVIIIRWDPYKYSPPYVPLNDYGYSGCMDINAGQCITYAHGLGGDPNYYFVHIYGCNNHGLHQANYGTNPDHPAPFDWWGLEWQRLNSSTIELCRAPDDDTNPSFWKRWDQVSVFIIRPLNK